MMYGIKSARDLARVHKCVNPGALVDEVTAFYLIRTLKLIGLVE